MKPFSAIAEIQRLVALHSGMLDDELPAVTVESLTREREVVGKSLERLAKEQWRASQQAEAVADQIKIAVEEMRRSSAALRDQGEEYRRENLKLLEEAKSAAVKVLTFVDSLDDVRVLAFQRGDSQWLKYVERLTRDAVTMLQSIAITEIPAAGRPFNPEEHEAVDTVDRPSASNQYDVVEVVQRGFRYKGKVLRRARVITAR